MRYLNGVRNLAISALAVGCLGNCGYLEATDIATAINNQPTSTQTVNCTLRVQIKVEFEGGKTAGKFDLYKDTDNKPEKHEIPFSVEGIKNPVIVMEIDNTCYKYNPDDGTAKVIKLKDDKTVDDDKAPEFSVLLAESDGSTNTISNAIEDGKKYNLALEDKTEKAEYKIIIEGKTPTEKTVLGDYKSGNIKFSITGE